MERLLKKNEKVEVEKGCTRCSQFLSSSVKEKLCAKSQKTAPGVNVYLFADFSILSIIFVSDSVDSYSNVECTGRYVLINTFLVYQILTKT